MNLKPSKPNNRFVEKTNGKGETILVPNPDGYDNEGNFRKIKKRVTNRTPPKKKRKK